MLCLPCILVLATRDTRGNGVEGSTGQGAMCFLAIAMSPPCSRSGVYFIYIQIAPPPSFVSLFNQPGGSRPRAILGIWRVDHMGLLACLLKFYSEARGGSEKAWPCLMRIARRSSIGCPCLFLFIATCLARELVCRPVTTV